MTIKQAQHAASIDAPKESNGYTLHPATFGLLEWLQSKRKNPLLCGGNVDLKHVAELCFAFTIPSIEICRLSDAKLTERIEAFSHTLSPADFTRIQKHAQTELEKFNKTSVVPKKPMRPKLKQKVKR